MDFVKPLLWKGAPISMLVSMACFMIFLRVFLPGNFIVFFDAVKWPEWIGSLAFTFLLVLNAVRWDITLFLMQLLPSRGAKLNTSTRQCSWAYHLGRQGGATVLNVSTAWLSWTFSPLFSCSLSGSHQKTNAELFVFVKLSSVSQHRGHLWPWWRQS